MLTGRLVLFGLGGFNTLGDGVSGFRLGFGLTLSRVNVLLSAALALLLTARPGDALRALRDAEHGRVARRLFVAALSHGNPLRPIA